MKASTLIRCLQKMMAAHGDLRIEVETELEIDAALRVRLSESDSERGNTFVIDSTEK